MKYIYITYYHMHIPLALLYIYIKYFTLNFFDKIFIFEGAMP